MNRIILIGNGFDIAHGMKTSYTDFINWYWSNVIVEIKKLRLGDDFENKELSIKRSPGTFANGKTYRDLQENLDKHKSKIEFKNKFLELITEKTNLNNWVDIENEYYEFLKRLYEGKVEYRNYDIDKLNVDFDVIKQLLGDYLSEVERDFDKEGKVRAKRIIHKIGEKIYSPLELNDFAEEHLSEVNNSLLGMYPNQIMILNFNYTYTESLYKSAPKDILRLAGDKFLKPEVNHIHGTTDQTEDNPIIFGFGDEIDKSYQAIEELNDNRYMENIKSIKYLESNSYRRLTEFINGDYFQVYIMGHSCGISDRTLLNTIFEHDNCASVKVYYHKKNTDEDNFSDLVRNISRNFNDKVKMRSRVVNKTLCEPLL